eukprot:TRINITY_DN4847_c0_g1_i2.p1 TRINITY_DN4847_c0_g1~~TRINITY_DN4847_c0_g1_i2.p1  ORF type:complete len:1357 (-),score=236.44 TRINITY_DN4847_c0_g1_i2:54-4124(-)
MNTGSEVQAAKAMSPRGAASSPDVTTSPDEKAAPEAGTSNTGIKRGASEVHATKAGTPRGTASLPDASMPEETLASKAGTVNAGIKQGASEVQAAKAGTPRGTVSSPGASTRPVEKVATSAPAMSERRISREDNFAVRRFIFHGATKYMYSELAMPRNVGKETGTAPAAAPAAAEEEELDSSREFIPYHLPQEEVAGEAPHNSREQHAPEVPSLGNAENDPARIEATLQQHERASDLMAASVQATHRGNLAGTYLSVEQQNHESESTIQELVDPSLLSSAGVLLEGDIMLRRPSSDCISESLALNGLALSDSGVLLEDVLPEDYEAEEDIIYLPEEEEEARARAAAKIQARYRGNTARASVVKEELEDMRRRDSACKIQALQRGRATRRQLASQEATTMQGDPEARFYKMTPSALTPGPETRFFRLSPSVGFYPEATQSAAFYLQVTGGVVGSRNCLSTTSTGAKVDLQANINDDGGSCRQRWLIVRGHDSSWYNIRIFSEFEEFEESSRVFLSTTKYGSRIGLQKNDDGSGLQRWVISKGGADALKRATMGGATSSWFHIKVADGVTGKRVYLSATPDGSRLDLQPSDDGSGRQRWEIPGFEEAQAESFSGALKSPRSQSRRRWRRQRTPEKPPEPRKKGAEDLMALLRQQRGCVLRAWRLDLDLRGTGRVARDDIERICRYHSIRPEEFWETLPSLGGTNLGELPKDFVGLEDLAPDETSNCALFVQAASDRGLSLDEAWQAIDSDGHGVVGKEQFVSRAMSLGFKGDGDLLFIGLDASGQGRLWKDEFDFLALTVPGLSWMDRASTDSQQASKPKVVINAPAAAEPTPKRHVRPKPLKPSSAKTVMEFLQWAVGRWPHLRELFGTDSSPVPGAPQAKYHSIMPEAFIHFVKGLGFQGDPQCIVNEIHRRAEVEQGAENGGRLTLAQLQLFRKQVEVLTVRRMAKALKKRRGAVLRAWRLDLDRTGFGLVSRDDLERVCRVIGMGDDANVIWEALRPSGGSQHPIELCEIEPGEATNLFSFTEAMLQKTNYHLGRIWVLLKSAPNGADRDTKEEAISRDQFEEAATRLGFPGDALLLFSGLASLNADRPETRLWRDELGYAWLLTLKAAEIRNIAAQSLDPSTEIPCGHSEQLLASMGFLGGSTPAAASVVARLESLGFSGNVLQAALDLVNSHPQSKPPPTSNTPRSTGRGAGHSPSSVASASHASSRGGAGRPRSTSAGRHARHTDWNDSTHVKGRRGHSMTSPACKRFGSRGCYRTNLFGASWKEDGGRQRSSVAQTVPEAKLRNGVAPAGKSSHLLGAAWAEAQTPHAALSPRSQQNPADRFETFGFVPRKAPAIFAPPESQCPIPTWTW